MEQRPSVGARPAAGSCMRRRRNAVQNRIVRERSQCSSERPVNACQARARKPSSARGSGMLRGSGGSCAGTKPLLGPSGHGERTHCLGSRAGRVQPHATGCTVLQPDVTFAGNGSRTKPTSRAGRTGRPGAEQSHCAEGIRRAVRARTKPLLLREPAVDSRGFDGTEPLLGRVCATRRER